MGESDPVLGSQKLFAYLVSSNHWWIRAYYKDIMSRQQSPTGFIYCFVCAVEVDNGDVKEKFSRQFIKIILSILQQRTESLAIRPTLFNQSQISSDRLNIFEWGCLFYPLRKKKKAIHAVFLLLWTAKLLHVSGFCGCQRIAFKRMGQIFSRSNVFVKFVFLLIQFDSLTRWLRFIIVLLPHRALSKWRPINMIFFYIIW